MADSIHPRSTAGRLRKLCPLRPTLAVVLGSGFHSVPDALEVEAEVSYRKLPGFAPVGVGGHAGKVLFAKAAGVPVLVLSGRAHYYEGHTMEQVTFPMRVLAAFGVRAVLLTNAAGAINRRYRAGDFMLLHDHLNFMGVNPLRGERAGDKTRFLDLTEAYDPGLNRLLKRAARETGITLHSGVYLAVSGPSYETPAEIRAFARLSADAIGMSTVPEVIVARQCGMAVAALSCITNRAAGRSRRALSHAEVLATATRVKGQASRLLINFARLFAQNQ